MQTFAKNTTGISILLKLDNTSAVAHINNLGGTVSPELVALAKNLWMWCLERNIHITAQDVPGILNQAADLESRTIRDRMDWKLNPAWFSKIDQLWGPIEGPNRGRFVCNQDHKAAPSLLQLAARSLCSSNRCLSTGLVTQERVCEPSMVPRSHSGEGLRTLHVAS